MAESEDQLERTGTNQNLSAFSLTDHNWESQEACRVAGTLHLGTACTPAQASEESRQVSLWEPQERLQGPLHPDKVSQQVTSRRCKALAVLPRPSGCLGCHLASAFLIWCTFLLARSHRDLAGKEVQGNHVRFTQLTQN